MSKSLPAQPSLRQLKNQAKEFHAALENAQPDAIRRFTEATGRPPGSAPQLTDAQLALAREYGFGNWAAFKEEVERREDRNAGALLNQFQNAVRGGNVALLEKLLEENAALKRRINDPLFDFGGSALLNAINRKDRPMIDALLKAGADLNQRSKWEPGGFGVLDRVDDELGAYLIARGAEVDIHAAAHLGKLDRIRSLLDADPGLVNARGGDGGTPLHFARNAEVADLLLQRGADVTLRDRDHGSTAAMWKVRNKPVLDRLIAAGSPIDIFMACVHGDQALAERALREDPECLGAFISHGGGEGKFAPDTGGNIYNWEIGHAARPIPVAAKFGHRALVDFLLERAGPADRLIAFCLMGDQPAVARLLRGEPGLAERLEKNQARALPDAVHFRNREAAKIMIAAGFPITAKGIENDDAMHLAAWHGDAELVRALLERKPNLENRDNDRQGTPLEAACHGSLHCWDKEKGDYPAVVKLLMGAGAEAGKQRERQSSGEAGWASPETMAAFA